MDLVFVHDLAHRLHREGLYTVWEHLLPCIQGGMILVTIFFLHALGLMVLTISAFCIGLHNFSRSF